ncbi:hypothetical protein ZOD2009_14111 [Haladaptatus paucihalophilus DX253]|uniref:Uncharacterized protein n=1 Tax=Haladaptatus paucihalophilus DX253 TaxID=797209 RepID=E7QVI6_HALPU|nr:hypothetical protein ZOD2009_14111 [Haladaptatus paucihalophilus DX253]
MFDARWSRFENDENLIGRNRAETGWGTDGERTKTGDAG